MPVHSHTRTQNANCIFKASSEMHGRRCIHTYAYSHMCNCIHTHKHRKGALEASVKVHCRPLIHAYTHSCLYIHIHARKTQIASSTPPLRCIQDAASMHTHVRAGTITGTHTRTGITSLKPQFNAVKTLHPRLRIFTHNASTENSVFEAYMRTHILTHVQAKHRHTRKHRKQCVRSLHAYAHSHTCTSKHRHTRKHRKQCVRSLHAYAHSHTCTSKAQTHTQAQKTVCSKPTCVRVLCILWQSISRVWCHSPDTCPQGRLPGAPFRKCRLIHRNKGAFAG
jgi:hypothetical protein